MATATNSRYALRLIDLSSGLEPAPRRGGISRTADNQETHTIPVTWSTLPSLVLITVVQPHTAHADDADTHEVVISGATVAGAVAAIEAKVEAGSEVVATISTKGTDGHAIVDAVQFVEATE